ncbi:MAG TPA: helix-turn-helix transcriptional regulator [Bauldia sp.]|nr:helix-turn-helix transcriptional regulator [Bauldia sp.]
MDEAARLSEVIGDLYDAALDPALWGAVLAEARDFVGGSAAAIFAKDAAATTLTVFHHDGCIDPHYTQLYYERYMALDPSNTAHFFSTVGEPISTTDFIDYDEFHETRFYKEWGRPQGLVDFITVALEKSMTSAALFGIFRKTPDGVADEDSKRRMRLIAPHIRRAVLIGKAIDLKAAQTASFADTLDALSAAMFMVQANGRIVHANAAAHAMLAGSGFLKAAGDRLLVRDVKMHQALMDVLAAAGNGDGAVGARGVALPLATRDGGVYLAHVLPLTSGARRKAANAYAAVAAVFVRKAELELPSTPEIIARHYRLTPSELRVLLAVIEVGGVPEVAEALGIADTTVKSHLGSVYGKTGTSRQADLVKLVAGFASPLAA